MFIKKISGLLIATTCLLMEAVVATAPPDFLPVVEVRFSRGVEFSSPLDLISDPLKPLVASINKLFTLSEGELNELASAGTDLPDLNLWFIIDLVEGADVPLYLSELQAQSNVDHASLVTEPPPQPSLRRSLQATPDYEPNQGYLDPSPGGIDAKFIWTITGGDGNGVKVYDVEREWTTDHEDLGAAAGVTPLVGAGFKGYAAPASDEAHGTAVLGELVGSDNGFGVTGICPAADVGLAEEYVESLSDGTLKRAIADAILLSVRDGSPGDIILLEVQTRVCGLAGCNSATQNNCGPVEWDQSVFDAIQTATANRFTVVEAAGNGKIMKRHVWLLACFRRPCCYRLLHLLTSRLH